MGRGSNTICNILLYAVLFICVSAVLAAIIWGFVEGLKDGINSTAVTPPPALEHFINNHHHYKLDYIAVEPGGEVVMVWEKR